jgi:hypothetical protein
MAPKLWLPVATVGGTEFKVTSTAEAAEFSVVDTVKVNGLLAVDGVLAVKSTSTLLPLAMLQLLLRMTVMVVVVSAPPLVPLWKHVEAESSMKVTAAGALARAGEMAIVTESVLLLAKAWVAVNFTAKPTLAELAVAEVGATETLVTAALGAPIV